MKKLLLLTLSLISLSALGNPFEAGSNARYEIEDLVSRWEGVEFKELKNNQKFMKELKRLQRDYDLKDFSLKDGSEEIKICSSLCVEI
jgi:hypothetical protein